MSSKTVQIVPRLPPATDGVGDYAFNLAQQLRQDHNIQTHFIVGERATPRLRRDRTWSEENTIDGFTVSQLSVPTAEALFSLLLEKQAHTVLLHYVGYGYAKRGCPTWLVDGLKTWRTVSTSRKLVTMFHEVYAAGEPPWTSAFWLFWWQKKLATSLVQLSDRILTSKQLYSEILSGLSQGKHRDIPAIPVFSNIGEPKQIACLSERQPWLVVFGGSNNRKRAYLESRSKISSVCQILGIEKIIDIGKSTELSLSNIDGIPLVETGKLSVEQIDEIFSNSRAGYLNYNPDYLAKSGIFAAYCAYGMLPVSARSSHSSIDGIESGKHYLIAPEKQQKSISLQQVQAIANNAYAWYQNHRLKAQAEIFANRIATHTKQNLIY